MNIILCGYKSCGKSTIAKAYSQSFSCRYIDTDSLMIEIFQSNHGQQCTIAEIYNALGALKFRQLEADVIKNMNQTSNAIIATGGGAVLEKNNVKHLKSLDKIGKIIYLQVNYNTLYERLLAADNIPSFINKNNQEKDLKNYLISRDDVYKNISDYMINITHQTIEEIISIIHQYRGHHGQ
jgi:shikimate kinase